MKTVKTKKGTELPLTNLKGKDYLMVAYRLQWLTEEAERYAIDTVTQHKTEDVATVQATITIADPEGRPLRRATARKTESRKDFNDFEEKAETGAIGRALAMLGFGTQHALSDLDEGDRIVDAPVVNGFKATIVNTPGPVEMPSEVVVGGSVLKLEETPKKTSFRKKSNGAKPEATPVAPKEDEGW